MEIAAKRTLVVASIMLVYGVAVGLIPKPVAPWKSEKWVEDNLPMVVGEYRMIASPENPTVSYKSDKKSYEKLKPYGIVARIFDNGLEQFDSMIVVGNDRDAFHDPNICLPSQNWHIRTEKPLTVKTKTRGDVPMMLMSAESPGGKRFVLYCYRGPYGFEPTQNKLYSDWFWSELKLGKPSEGGFYRFMTLNDNQSEDSIVKFVSEWIDRANETSSGQL